MPTRHINWKGLKFTGDTNCSVNWQAGFDIAGCPGDPNTDLNSGGDRMLNASGLATIFGGGVAAVIGLNADKNKAANAQKQALAEVRKIFPGPGVCITGSESLPVYLGNGKWGNASCGSSCTYIVNAIRYMQAALNDFHIPRGDQAYIAAYNQVISEYNAYYNSNCIAATPAAIPASSNEQTPGLQTTDPVTGKPAATAQQPTVNGQPLANTQQSTTSAITGTAKKIPTWAWWVGGGLLSVIVIVAVVKK